MTVFDMRRASTGCWVRWNAVRSRPSRRLPGACTGGGAAIAAACDLRIAATNARFGFPIARTLANCLSMSNLARLSALIGPARVIEMIFTARLFSAAEAMSAGLVTEVLPDQSALQARALELATLLAGHAPLTMRATKEALRRLRDNLPPDEDLIRLCYTSRDFREGMDAFLTKRPPVWEGRLKRDFHRHDGLLNHCINVLPIYRPA